jgi:hypothetical protein
VFDVNSDGRRRPQRDRIKKDQELLHRLLSMLSSRSDDELKPLLQAIREKDPIANIEEILSASPFPKSSPRTAFAVSSWVDQTYESGRSASSQAASPTAIQLSTRGPASGPDPSSAMGIDSGSQATPSIDGLSSSGSAVSLSSGDRYISPGAVTSFRNLPMSSAVVANHWPPAIQSQQLDLFTKPDYLCTPSILHTDAPLAQTTLGFLHAARSRILQGESIAHILSMDGLDLDLFFRKRRPEDPHTVSTWACEITRAYFYLPFPIQLNAVHCVGTFMRWMIYPCRETWLQMSPMMRPLKCQIVKPHTSMYADLIHIPQLRLCQLEYGRQVEQLLTKPGWVALRNWTLGDHACVELEAGVPRRISATLIEHIDDPRSWSLHQFVLDDYPELGQPENSIELHDDATSRWSLD